MKKKKEDTLKQILTEQILVGNEKNDRLADRAAIFFSGIWCA
jgi:hypothetical protein